MHLKTRNVNTAFKELVSIFYHKEYSTSSDTFDVKIDNQSSRNGAVLKIDEPVTITYAHPRERVLFNQVRDCNCFFHLYEALWMLAGRDDVASLAFYNSKVHQFSDDYYEDMDGINGTFNGAYGKRWRTSSGPPKLINPGIAGYRRDGIDQLNILVEHLKADPNSRRAVLQMWNLENDLLKIGEGNCTCTKDYAPPPQDMRASNGHYNGCQVNRVSKDLCCNTSVMFSLREERLTIDRFLAAEHVKTEGSIATMKPPPACKYLDMTVTNRSNDLLWGLLGSNYVCFSLLQEYMAARLGVQVGLYHHFTNNLHVYKDRPDWRPEILLDWYDNAPVGDYHETAMQLQLGQSNPERIDEEINTVVTDYGCPNTLTSPYDLDDDWLRQVAVPMLEAWQLWKGAQPLGEVVKALDRVACPSWRWVAIQWIDKRVARRKNNADN